MTATKGNAKFVLIDNYNDLSEIFETEAEVETYLQEEFDGDVEDVRVFEVDTEYQVTKKYELEEVDA
jgi:hypothetical protein